MDSQARARTLIERLSGGDFAAVVAGFDPTMKTHLPEAALAATWTALSAQVGALQAVEGVTVTRSGELEIAVAVCRFERSPLAVRVAFHAPSGEVTGLFFTPVAPPPAPGLPPYAEASAFTEVEIRVGEGAESLPGTLSVPSGEGPFPAVVLVHGSGPHDRDETVGANRPFRDLAYGLSSAGIAVLRYEKRTKACPASLAKLGEALTVQEETVDDAVLAVRLLLSTARIDPSRIFVLGHSLGGHVAPRIGRAAPEIAGLIVLAGNVRPLEDLILEQLTYLLPLQAPKEIADTQLEALRPRVARVKSRDLGPSTPATDLPLNLPAPYWIDLNRYSPTETARALGKPILVLQGGRDYQVTVEDLDLWKAALDGMPGARCLLLPDLNHLFMTGEGKGRPEEYMVPGHVAAQVIEEITSFVRGAKSA